MVLQWEKEVWPHVIYWNPQEWQRQSQRGRGSAWCGHGCWALRKIWPSADHTLNLSKGRAGLLPFWPMTGWFYTADQMSSSIFKLLPRNHRPLKLKTSDFIHTDKSYSGHRPWAHVHKPGAEYVCGMIKYWPAWVLVFSTRVKLRHTKSSTQIPVPSTKQLTSPGDTSLV